MEAALLQSINNLADRQTMKEKKKKRKTWEKKFRAQQERRVSLREEKSGKRAEMTRVLLAAFEARLMSWEHYSHQLRVSKTSWILNIYA